MKRGRPKVIESVIRGDLSALSSVFHTLPLSHQLHTLIVAAHKQPTSQIPVGNFMELGFGERIARLESLTDEQANTILDALVKALGLDLEAMAAKVQANQERLESQIAALQKTVDSMGRECPPEIVREEWVPSFGAKAKSLPADIPENRCLDSLFNPLDAFLH